MQGIPCQEQPLEGTPSVQEKDSSYKVIAIKGKRGFQLQSIANAVRSICIIPIAISNNSLSTSHNKAEQRYSQDQEG